MNWRARMTLVLAAAAAAVSHAQAAVPQSRSWTFCTPGSLRSCNSVQILTTAIMTGSTRTGTGVTIRIQNRQGTEASDNTGGSNLFTVVFSGSGKGNPFVFNGGVVTGNPVGPGASGTAFSRIETGAGPTHEFATWAFGNGVSGCVPVVTPEVLVAPAQTCGEHAWIEYSIESFAIVDAESLDRLSIRGWTVNQDELFCQVGGGPGSSPADACDVISSTVTPEPVTILLLGSGLVGIGGARLRRRRRSNPEA